MKHRWVLSAFLLVALAQLAVPASMVFRQERTLASGHLYKFKTAPVDPYDAVRGRYVSLSFEGRYPQVLEGVEPKAGQNVYVEVQKDRDGFAHFGEATESLPVGKDYLKLIWDDRGAVSLPFDRYYLDEFQAPEAERAYRATARQDNSYLVVRILDGNWAIEDLYVGGKPIREALQATTVIGVTDDLVRAADRGDLNGVRELLAKGVDVNGKDIGGRVAIASASAKCHTDVVRYLLTAGAKVNAKDGQGESALMMASQFNCPEVLKLLLANGAEPNAKSLHGLSPLSWASMRGNIESVRVLLANNADINVRSENGDTPLIIAARVSSCTDILRALLENGADIRLKNRDGKTALDVAKFPEIKDFLVKAGANKNAAP